jgi:hypothetical protein
MSIALTQPPGTRVAEAKDSVVQTRNARDTWLSQNWQDFPPRSPSGDPATNRVTLAWNQTWRKVSWQGGRREGDSAVWCAERTNRPSLRLSSAALAPDAWAYALHGGAEVVGGD